MEEIMQSIISAIARPIGPGYGISADCLSQKRCATAIKRPLLHITTMLLPMAAWA